MGRHASAYLDHTGRHSHSYIFITNIPSGATDIQIIERHKTENILALSDEAGHFFFNGNTVFDNPQNFRVAGTVFKYRRPSSVFSDGLEYIIAQGPTQQSLHVMYYNLNGKLPHITYEYTVPLTSHDITAVEDFTTGPDKSHINCTYNEVSEDVTEDLTRSANHSRGEASVPHYNTYLGSEDQSDVHLHEEEEDEEGVEWEIRTPSPPPPAAMLVFRADDVTRHVFTHNDVEEPGPPAPANYRSSSNSVDEPSTADDNALLLPFPGQSVHSAVLPDDAPYLLLENLQLNQTHSNTHSLTQSNTHSVPQSHSHSESTEKLSTTDTDTLTVKEIQTEGDTHSDSHSAILVQLQQVSAVQAVNTERYEGRAGEKTGAL